MVRTLRRENKAILKDLNVLRKQHNELKQGRAIPPLFPTFLFQKIPAFVDWTEEDLETRWQEGLETYIYIYIYPT